MSDNEKNEEKWTLNFRDDQCQFISDAMSYFIARAEERIGDGKYAPFDKFAAAACGRMAVEIKEQIAGVTA